MKEKSGYNHGTKTMGAKLGNRCETPFGLDRSDMVGAASEERRSCDGDFGGGGASLAHSIKGATAKQGNSN